MKNGVRSEEALRRMPDASSELTEAEISARYGSLIATALHHFEHDTTYLVDMAYSSTLAEAKRVGWQVWRERRDARREAAGS